MAKNQIVLMVPEGERKSYKYSFTVKKSVKMQRENKKLRMHKYDPSKQNMFGLRNAKFPHTINLKYQ